MKILVIACTTLVLSATAAAAFPDSFGLPHFVQVDEWPGDDVDRMETGSVRKAPCDVPSADARCADRYDRGTRQMPLK